jgi:exopolyphosphatase/guanosine-5'-triphosphate,3'-diphosphate pyrophosphatase
VRLGVLDVGSNTVHLLVVDAHRGAHPTPTDSRKTVLRLAERIDADGDLTAEGAAALIETVAEATDTAAELGCEELLGFATSAVRDARNCAEVLAAVHAGTGVRLRVLSGEDESRLTFLAVRRWFGWSAGWLQVLDIGGGSLEIAAGRDEDPELALSLPLGAGRLTRVMLRHDPPGRAELAALREHADEVLREPAARLRAAGTPDRAVATSKTFRTLARLTGAAPSAAGPRVRRVITRAGLRQLIAFISRMPAADLAGLEGVSASRAHQLVAGAVVAEAAMRALALPDLEVCPWALREGLILRRLDATFGANDADGPSGAAGPDLGAASRPLPVRVGHATRDDARVSTATGRDAPLRAR